MISPILQLAHQIMGQIIPMLSKFLNGPHVAGVDCLHKISQIQEASLKLVFMPRQNILFI